MKRLVLCAVAVLLTSGALIGTRPAHACVINPACVSQGCGPQCGTEGGFCNTCTGRCLCGV